MNREKEIFEQALDLSSAEERMGFLKGACGGDATMLERLLGLLRASEGASAFLPEAPQQTATLKIDVPASGEEALGSRISHYKLLQKVGEGGCGVVYMAEQEQPFRRRVALKVIKLGMDTRSVVARFEAERQALAMMDHPNIAKVLDAGTTEKGRPFFVMELVRGIRITDYCDQNQLSTKARLELFISVCHAVQHAHQKGIIHRDLKPSNILVTLHDGVPVPKVIDFGIAKAIEQKLTDKTLFTELHQFIGTPAYMSPEQAEMSGLDIDTRSDIYSLGVLLYELLTGKTPFDAQELMSQGIDAMRKTIREKEPLRPSTKLSQTLVAADVRRLKSPATETPSSEEEIRASSRRLLRIKETITLLKGDLDWIVMKCLEKDRARRYDTANGLATDIKRHLSNETVVARPPSSAYRFQKLVRRNKLAFVAGTAIVAVLVVGLAASVWQAIRATHAEQEQKKLREVAVKALEGEKVQRTQAEAERQRAETNAEKFKNASIQSRRSQYAADMFAATAEIEKGSYGNARSFLREYFPREGLEELRAFEWRYLWQLSAGQQLNIYPISGQVIDMAWSPDGGLMAVASSDRTVKLLRATAGEVKNIFTNGSDFNVSVAFSHDGNGLAVAGLRSPVRFWDVRDGRLIFALTNFVSARVACSPTSPLMAVGTGGDWWGQRGSNVYLVDINSGKEVRMLPEAGDRMAFSRDGKRLATANSGSWQSGQSVILWDVDSGQKLHVLGNQRQVLGMAFSPDGNLLAFGTRYGDVTLWNLNDFTHSTLREATGDFARSVAFSPDGRWLAVAMLTQEVEIWDVENRRLAERLHGHTWEVNAVAYSPDGSQLASGCQDGTIRFWNPHPATIQRLMPEVRWAQNMKAGFPTFSPDSRWMAAAMINGDMHIVDTTTADWSARTVLTNAGLPITFSRDASTLLTLESEAMTLRRWNAASKALLSTTRLETTNVTWGYSSITPDGNLLALANNRGPIEIFETRTGRRIDRLERRGLIDSIELSRDGQLLAIGTGNSGMLWNIAAQRPMWTGKGHRDRVFSIRFSPDQKMIATGSWDSDVRLWDVATGKELAVLTGHTASVLNCAFSPDGRTLATKSDDRTIKFWNLATLREVASIPLDYTGNVQGNFLAFSPDGQILTANDSGPGLRCWRASTLAEIDAAEAKSVEPLNR